MTHNIIKTENYLLAVDDSEIKEGDWYLTFTNNEVIGEPRKCEDTNWNFTHCKKIIAHLPLNNSPVLEGVPLLPPLEDEAESLSLKFVNKRGYTTDDYQDGFEDGYNKAKEKYNADLGELLSDFYLFATNGEVCDHEVINEFIQSIQQSKTPVEFECEVERIYPNPQTISKEYDFDDILIERKTTTNSQGQTVLVGKYIY